MPGQTVQKTRFSKPTLHFRYAGLTNTGLLRDHNEDAYRLPEDADADTLQRKGHLYVLADGMGGHEKGEVASAITIEIVNAEYYATLTQLDEQNPEEAITNALTQAIQKANNEVMDVTEGGGTTVVAAVLHGDMLVAVNVGDSRAYLLRDRTLKQLSRDHSLVSRLVELGKITEEEALTHPRRNVLYQALGQGTDVEIHIASERLQADDVIILCSDGLWGEVAELAITEVIANANSPLAATEQLIKLANASGGPDNITAIIIQVSNQEEAHHESATLDNDNPDDTKPSTKINLEKPKTLPEGKYHVDSGNGS
ncbi:MAG: protein phosphatase 2C domain-containing protein [Chloroflexota bacterium]